MDDIYSVLNSRLPLSLVEGVENARDEAELFVAEKLAQWWYPPPLPDPIEWCRQTLRLTDSQSPAHAGEPVDFERVPHAKIVLRFLNDQDAETLSMMKSSAATLSTSIVAALVYILKFDPGGILYLTSNQDEARAISKKLWQPFLRQAFGDVVMDKSDQANLHLQVNGVDIMCGAPSEALLRGKQFRYIIEDESDTMKDALPGGGNDLEVALDERTKGARGRKIIRLCAPLVAYDPSRPKVAQPGARIHRNYLAGDQRKYFCPCPACKFDVEFVETDFHYEQCRLTDGSGGYDLDRLLHEVVWKCPQCGHIVEDSSAEKTAMIRAGRDIPTATARSKKDWSAWFTDFVMLVGSATWGRIIYDLEKARGTAKWPAVRRSHLGEPEAVGGGVSVRGREMILRHCAPYDRGTCPVVPWAIGVVSDVQRNREMEALYGGVVLRFPWVVGAIAREPAGAIYVIDWGEEEDYAALYARDAAGRVVPGCLFGRGIPLRVAESAWRKAHGERPMASVVYPTYGLMDSGFYARGKAGYADEGEAVTEAVYSFCARTRAGNRFHFNPVKGAAGVQIKCMVKESWQVHAGATLPLYRYDDWAWKTRMDIVLRSDPSAPSPVARGYPQVHLPRPEHTGTPETPEDPDTDLISHLTAERLGKVMGKDNWNRDVEKTGWVTVGRNDWWDGLKILHVLGEILAQKAARGSVAA